MNRRQNRPWNKQYGHEEGNDSIESFLARHPLPPDDRSVHVSGAPERTWVDFKDYRPEVGEDEILIWFGFYKTAKVCTYLGWDDKDGFPIYETDNPEFMDLHPYYWMWYSPPPRKLMMMSFTTGTP